LIDVTSTPKGTTFYIGIPLTDPEKATEPNWSDGLVSVVFFLGMLEGIDFLQD
jgi:hypothetical protein